MTEKAINRFKRKLDPLVEALNTPAFISLDPLSIPRRYTEARDQEIAGFLAAIIAWGRRDIIIRNAGILMEHMGHQPYRFITEASEKEVFQASRFVHRTFQPDDCLYFLTALRNLLSAYGSLEACFAPVDNISDTGARIHYFRQRFLAWPHLPRTAKHLADPKQGSAAKRINMFLRWMVRKDAKGVDLGIWHSFDPSQLYCPLDVHSGRVARAIGLLSRPQDDWKAVVELTGNLRMLDPLDPVKYDFALFGLGVHNPRLLPPAIRG